MHSSPHKIGGEVKGRDGLTPGYRFAASHSDLRAAGVDNPDLFIRYTTHVSSVALRWPYQHVRRVGVRTYVRNDEEAPGDPIISSKGDGDILLGWPFRGFENSLPFRGFENWVTFQRV